MVNSSTSWSASLRVSSFEFQFVCADAAAPTAMPASTNKILNTLIRREDCSIHSDSSNKGVNDSTDHGFMTGLHGLQVCGLSTGRRRKSIFSIFFCKCRRILRVHLVYEPL